jgi:iron complex outermembrane recepter protein
MLLMTEQYLLPALRPVILVAYRLNELISAAATLRRADLGGVAPHGESTMMRGLIMAFNASSLRRALPALGIVVVIWCSLLNSPARAQDDSPTMLKEVIVTAQHRAEPLQKVPIYVNVVSAHVAAAMGVTTMSDLPMVVPGLLLGTANGGAVMTIRGISSTSTSGDELATAIYVDGVYLAAAPAAMFALSNIQRVEVDKGPQGTLFGRNAIGGAIQVITQDPSQVTDADVQLDYGNYDTATAELYGTTGITDHVAVNFSAYMQNMGEGWGINTYNFQQAHQGHQTDLRSKIEWSPSADTSVMLILMANDVYDPSAQSYQVFPGYYTAAHVPSNGIWNEDSNENQSSGAISRNVALKIRQEMGWAELVSITDYDNSKFPQVFDQDATDLALSDVFLNRTSTTESQEFQLISPTGGRFNWQAGTFLFHDVYAYAPLVFTGKNNFSVDSTMPKTSYAVYGQGTLDLGWNTNLTLGTRYTRDDTSMDGTRAPTAAGYPAHQSAVSTRETYRASLDHAFTQTLMAYVSYNTGYKSGLYNMSNPLNSYAKPEYVEAYEGGLKSEWFDHRLRVNLAAYYNSFTNMQVKAAIFNVVLLQNAARATIKGVDFDFQAALPGGLMMLGGASYENGFYNSFPNSQIYDFLPDGYETTGVGDVTGHRTVQTPQWVYSVGLQYTVPSSRGDWTFSADFKHTDMFYWDPQSIVPEAPYDLLNGQMKWSPSEHFDLMLWVKNALDAKYWNQGNPTGFGPTGYPAPPRTFGITGEWHMR